MIVTEWDELRDLACDEVRAAMRNPLIVDGRNLLDPHAGPRSRLRLRGRRPSDLSVLGPARDGGAGAAGPALMEALVLAGGKAERLGDAAGGLPKPLVRVGGRPLAEYQVLRLVGAGVTRVIIGCRAGHEPLFQETLSGLGAEIVAVGEPEPLGRGGGLRFAAAHRAEEGPVFALNGDEILDVDLSALLGAHRSPRRRRDGRRRAGRTRRSGSSTSPTATASPASRRRPSSRTGSTPASTCSTTEALARLPERGDHETSTFPELAEEGKLFAYRHEGTWLTVNTPKDLRKAEEFLAAHPDWQAAPA